MTPDDRAEGPAPARAALGHRLRTTTLLLALVALVGAASVAAGWWLASIRADDEPAVETRTVVRQVGDRLTLVQVEAIDGVDPGAARAATARAALVALGALLVVGAGVAWWWTGRARRTDPAILAAIEAVGAADAPDAARAPIPDDIGGALARLTARVAAHERETAHHVHEVAHELRTPLAAARTNLDLATAPTSTGPERVERLAAVERALDRLGGTVESLSEHGRLAYPPGSTRLDLGEEAEALVDEVRGPARARGLHLVTVAPTPVPAAVDRDAFRTALGNLLDNAVRLAPGGSTVTVRVGCDDEWAHCSVRDEGPGIAPADHPHVFRRGWRGRYDADRADGRTPRGLGLAIARQVVESQGGRLTLRSVEGVGSTFVVWLPVDGASDAAPHAADVIDHDGIHHHRDP